MDTRRVYISLDNGEIWRQFFASNDNKMEYHKVVLDLSNYHGMMVGLRFEFDTVDDQFNEFRGWFVDDIKIGIFEPMPSLSFRGC